MNSRPFSWPPAGPFVSVFLVLAVLCTSTQAHAQQFFFEDFETNLSQWTGKSGGGHNGIIVEDPLRPGNHVLQWTQVNSGGDMFSIERFAPGDCNFFVTFEYLGVFVDANSPGGFIGLSDDYPGNHIWIGGSIPYGPAEQLVSDNNWNTFCIPWTICFVGGAHVMLEDFISPPLNAYMDNIRLVGSQSPEAEGCVNEGLDMDMDGINNDSDTCPFDPENDLDGDGICGDRDLCPDISDPDQADLDGDGLGDFCDDDVDGDGAIAEDDCDDYNPAIFEVIDYYSDVDADGAGDPDDSQTLCQLEPPEGYVTEGNDNCPEVSNVDQADLDGDGFGDVCDDDVDGDGTLAGEDCNDRDDTVQVTQVFFADADGDGFGDPENSVTLCQLEPPEGHVVDGNDNCPLIANPEQSDLDEDGLGDVCDGDVDGDGAAAAGDCDDRDAAVQTLATFFGDADADGFGDPEDSVVVCTLTPPEGYVVDGSDNCPVTGNPDQEDLDGDELGDACDDDVDGDGATADVDCDDTDSEVWSETVWYLDQDADGWGDDPQTVTVCGFSGPEGYVDHGGDNCPEVSNPDQLDTDEDGVGDACDAPDVTPTPTVPDVTPTPTVPDVTPTPTVPDVTPTPGGPDVTPTSTVPDVTPTPVVPDVTPTPAAPVVTPTPVVPDVTPTPGGPDVTPTPSVPDTTPTPEVPGATPTPGDGVEPTPTPGDETNPPTSPTPSDEQAEGCNCRQGDGPSGSPLGSLLLVVLGLLPLARYRRRSLF